MSKKSIFLSILSTLLFGGMLIAIVFLFKFNLLAGIAGVVLLIFPVMLQKKAIDEASGTADKIIAKYIVPALAIVLTFLCVMSLAVWIK